MEFIPAVILIQAVASAVDLSLADHCQGPDEVAFNGFCYHVTNTSLTHDQAREVCAAQPGGHLVDVNSREENDFLSELLLAKTGGQSVHTAGVSMQHFWLWQDSESNIYDFFNWHLGVPPKKPNPTNKFRISFKSVDSNRCLVLQPQPGQNDKPYYYFSVNDCNDALPFVCERPLVYTGSLLTSSFSKSSNWKLVDVKHTQWIVISVEGCARRCLRSACTAFSYLRDRQTCMLHDQVHVGSMEPDDRYDLYEMRLLGNSKDTLASSSNCGARNGHEETSVSGSLQVGLMSRGHRLDCSPVILSEFYLLTGAHCLGTLPADDLDVLVGAGTKDHVDLQAVIGPGSQDQDQQVFDVERIIIHHNSSRFDDDIALVRLSPRDGRGIRFTNQIQPVCLPGHDTPLQSGTKCLVTGRGLPNDPAHSSTAVVPIIDQDQCRQFYSNLSGGMLCAGNMAGGGNFSCGSDSGRPLMCAVHGRYTLFGLGTAGRGVKNCGNPSKPSIYVNVQHHLNWIQAHVRDS